MQWMPGPGRGDTGEIPRLGLDLGLSHLAEPFAPSSYLILSVFISSGSVPTQAKEQTFSKHMVTTEPEKVRTRKSGSCYRAVHTSRSQLADITMWCRTQVCVALPSGPQMHTVFCCGWVWLPWQPVLTAFQAEGLTLRIQAFLCPLHR